MNKNHFSKCNILGSSLIIVIGIILLVTTIVVMGLNRQLTAKKLSRTDRLISEEFEIKRTLINLITQKYGYYVFDGNDIDALITSCDKDLALFKFWYSDSYHGVSYRVSACDNKDNLPSYTQDQDGFLWFKVDVDYGDGRKKPFHALIGPSIVAIPTPTPSPTPSPTSGPTSTRTPSPTPTFAPECLEDFKTVPCPSPTPCVDAKGLPIPCPSSTPCEAIDFLGVLGVPGATVTVRCRTCTDKFSNPTACPSPTITPPPSPTPTPTATPTPTGTPTSTPTATPTPSPTPTPEETPTPEPSPTPDQCTSYAVLGIHAYQFPDGTTNPGSGNPSGVSACGHSITGLMSRTGNNITLTCYHNGTIVASQVVAVTSSVGFFSIGRSIHGLPEGGAVHYVKCDIMGTEVFRLYIN